MDTGRVIKLEGPVGANRPVAQLLVSGLPSAVSTLACLSTHPDAPRLRVHGRLSTCSLRWKGLALTRSMAWTGSVLRMATRTRTSSTKLFGYVCQWVRSLIVTRTKGVKKCTAGL